MTEADLIRFINAQAQIYAQVVEELTSGRKSTHWMWFIFPQLAVSDEALWPTATPLGIWIRPDGT